MNNMLFNIKNFTTIWLPSNCLPCFIKHYYNNFELPTLSIIILKKGGYTRKQVDGLAESVRIDAGLITAHL